MRRRSKSENRLEAWVKIALKAMLQFRKRHLCLSQPTHHRLREILALHHTCILRRRWVLKVRCHHGQLGVIIRQVLLRSALLRLKEGHSGCSHLLIVGRSILRGYGRRCDLCARILHVRKE